MKTGVTQVIGGSGRHTWPGLPRRGRPGLEGEGLDSVIGQMGQGGHRRKKVKAGTSLSGRLSQHSQSSNLDRDCGVRLAPEDPGQSGRTGPHGREDVV